MKEFILEMEEYASEHNVPIIEKESIAFIMKYIKVNNIKKILEIGSAIGYSAILMASVDPEIEITTIERDEARYMECLKNVKKCGLDKRINVVFQDKIAPIPPKYGMWAFNNKQDARGNYYKRRPFYIVGINKKNNL